MRDYVALRTSLKWTLEELKFFQTSTLGFISELWKFLLGMFPPGLSCLNATSQQPLEKKPWFGANYAGHCGLTYAFVEA